MKLIVDASQSCLNEEFARKDPVAACFGPLFMAGFRHRRIQSCIIILPDLSRSNPLFTRHRSSAHPPDSDDSTFVVALQARLVVKKRGNHRGHLLFFFCYRSDIGGVDQLLTGNPIDQLLGCVWHSSEDCGELLTHGLRGGECSHAFSKAGRVGAS